MMLQVYLLVVVGQYERKKKIAWLKFQLVGDNGFMRNAHAQASAEPE